MRGCRKALGSLLALATVVAGVAVTWSRAGALAQDDPASRALEYLQVLQSGVDGSIPSSFPSYLPAELDAIGAAAAGYDPKALRHGSGPSVMDYLAAHAAGACAQAGACGLLVQAVVAAGLDPHSFAGTDPVAILMADYHPASGTFGAGDAYTQALAIQGLVAAAAPVPAGTVTFLVHAQDADGGWGFGTYGSDTNTTSMVLMALDAAGVHGRDASCLRWLRSQERPDGGFAYQAGSPSDPDSTALVLQAIVAAADPAGPAWTISGHTPLGFLVGAQGSDGGFTYPGNPGPDPYTTSEVPLALERVGFPVPFSSRAFYAPGATFGASPSPGPSPISTPTPPPAGVVTGAGALAAPAPTGAPVSTSPRVVTPAPPAPSGAVAAVTVAPSPAPRALGAGSGSGLPVFAAYLMVLLGAAVLVVAVSLGIRRVRAAG